MGTGLREEGAGRDWDFGCGGQGAPPTHTHTHQKAPCERRASGSRSADPTVGKRAIQAEGGKRIGPRLTRQKGRWGLQRKGRLGATDGVRGGGAAQGKGVRGLERAKGLWLLL